MRQDNEFLRPSPLKFYSQFFTRVTFEGQQ